MASRATLVPTRPDHMCRSRRARVRASQTLARSRRRTRRRRFSTAAHAPEGACAAVAGQLERARAEVRRDSAALCLWMLSEGPEADESWPARVRPVRARHGQRPRAIVAFHWQDCSVFFAIEACGAGSNWAPANYALGARAARVSVAFWLSPRVFKESSADKQPLGKPT